MSNFEVLDAFISLRRSLAAIRGHVTKDMEFGHNQIAVLHKLSYASATMGELAEYTLSDKGAISRTVSVLEKEGYVKRTNDKDDRRIVHIELTAKGRTHAQKAQKLRDVIGRTLDQTLTAAERKQFAALTSKITEKLKIACEKES